MGMAVMLARAYGTFRAILHLFSSASRGIFFDFGGAKKLAAV
jgi:hypothetical protein